MILIDSNISRATKRSIAQSSDLTLDIEGSDRELDSATPHMTDFLGQFSGWLC
jgi:hypothetical protein